MINPLALKVGLGGAVATTAGTVGIVYKDKIKDFFAQLSSKTSTFIVVKATTGSDSDITRVLYENDGKTKNFKCIVTTNNNLEDENCDLLEITAPQASKLNNLKEIKDSTTKATKEKIKTNTFFKLTISDSVLASAKWDGTQKVDIVSKTENKTDSSDKKKYGVFTLQYKVTDDVVEGKTNLIIGKITKKDVDADLSDNPTFNCMLTGETEKKVCSLFKIAAAPTAIKDVVLTGVKAAAKTQADYAVDNWYVIDLKRTTDKKNISELKTKNIIVVVNQVNPEKAVATFEFQAALSESETAFSDNNISKIIFA